MVRQARSVHRKARLTFILSDGQQARVVAKDIGDRVHCIDQNIQIVIDGARGMSSRWLKSSDICTFRRRASKSCSAGNKIDYATGR